jgi:hypothetical protein
MSRNVCKFGLATALVLSALAFSPTSAQAQVYVSGYYAPTPDYSYYYPPSYNYCVYPSYYYTPTYSSYYYEPACRYDYSYRGWRGGWRGSWYGHGWFGRRWWR